MNKKIIILSICMLMCSSPANAFLGFGKSKPAEDEPAKVIVASIEENTVLSLSNCLQLALEHNPAIKAATQNAEVYRAKIGQAKSAYVPDFSITTGYNRSNALMTSTMPKSFDASVDNYVLGNVTASQLFYDFGKTSANVNVQKMNFNSSTADLNDIINKVTYSVKEAYYNFLLAQQQQEVMEDSVLQYETLLEQASALYEIGTKAKIDVTIAKTNLSNANLSLIKAKNSVELARVLLNKAMGLINSPQYTLKEKLQYKPYDIKIKKIIDVAYKNRPEIISAEAQLTAAESLIKLSKRAVVPELKGSGEYTIGGSELTADQGWSVGINLSVPTFNPYKTKKLVDEAKSMEKRETARLEQAKHDVYLDVKQAYLNYLEANQSVPVANQSVIQAKENYELASGRYKVGLSTPIEFKDAELMHRNAKLEYLKNLYNYNVAIANIEKVIAENL